jgi:PhoPQ-activated pathogenicity-related protein
MFIGGGGNPKVPEAPDMDNGPMEKIAVLTKSIVAQVKQIPNQPLYFVGETMEKYKDSGRSEDELITFGWDKYLEGGDPIWLARLPMTKAVVRAMDITQKEFPQIDGFFVAGGSKRGWTTWTVAAVDKRVFGIAPAVIDVLNFEPSLANHFDAYGFWAPAIENYTEMKIVDRLHTPEMRNLLSVVDPYSYRDRLTMPKYVLNGAGDQYFAPDSWKFYFNDLKGEKFLCYVPNVDHGLNGEAYFMLASFYQTLLAGTPLPKFTWNKAEDGSLTVKCETKPDKVLLWQACNPDARDFRLATLGPKYESSPAVESQPGVYTSNVKPAEKGWTAFFIELEYANPGFGAPLKFTTGISILPDTYPGRKAVVEKK